MGRYPHDEPGCFDRVFLKWIQDGLTERVSHIDSLGIAYMYVGAYVPDKSDHATPGSPTTELQGKARSASLCLISSNTPFRRDSARPCVRVSGYFATEAP
jgi:hypothetical protein